jgi:hypothetical protein
MTDGPRRAAEAVKRAADRAALPPGIYAGKITEAGGSSASGYAVEVSLEGERRWFLLFGKSFRDELAAAEAGAGLPALVGSMVEVHYTAGRQANIAYTLGSY